jgi:transcriptional regulator with XRE-family HTH domain
MNEQKRKRLEAAGWKVGTAREFLGLTEEEAAFVELKLALARSVKLWRSARRLSQKNLAKLLGSSQSRVAKMEAADPSVSIDLLIRSLLALGARRTDLASVIRLRKLEDVRRLPIRRQPVSQRLRELRV